MAFVTHSGQVIQTLDFYSTAKARDAQLEHQLSSQRDIQPLLLTSRQIKPAAMTERKQSKSQTQSRLEQIDILINEQRQLDSTLQIAGFNPQSIKRAKITSEISNLEVEKNQLILQQLRIQTPRRDTSSMSQRYLNGNMTSINANSQVSSAKPIQTQKIENQSKRSGNNLLLNIQLQSPNSDSPTKTKPNKSHSQESLQSDSDTEACVNTLGFDNKGNPISSFGIKPEEQGEFAEFMYDMRMPTAIRQKSPIPNVDSQKKPYRDNNSYHSSMDGSDYSSMSSSMHSSLIINANRNVKQPVHKSPVNSVRSSLAGSIHDNSNNIGYQNISQVDPFDKTIYGTMNTMFKSNALKNIEKQIGISPKQQQKSQIPQYMQPTEQTIQKKSDINNNNNNNNFKQNLKLPNTMQPRFTSKQQQQNAINSARQQSSSSAQQQYTILSPPSQRYGNTMSRMEYAAQTGIPLEQK